MMKSLAIEREFGSGGREVGMIAARMAGIPYYDGELLVKAARERGVSLELLQEYDEQRTGSILYNIAQFASFGQDVRNSSMYKLCHEMGETIRQIAMRGPAVFIGRCSTEVLRENGRTVRAYIYCSEGKKRLERVMRTEQVTETEAKRLMEKKDRQRMDYFKFLTGRKWEDRANYDLEINTSAFSPENCARILLQAMEM